MWRSTICQTRKTIRREPLRHPGTQGIKKGYSHSAQLSRLLQVTHMLA